VPSWRRIPAERVLAVEALTGVPRTALRPDLYPESMSETNESAREVDDVDRARADEYALLATLLLRAPDAVFLARLARLTGGPTPLGLAHIQLAEAASAVSAQAVAREYFDLFIGVSRGELLPYASFYLTGFLNDRPLVRLRDDLRRLGLERAEGHFDPEDHIGSLCEIMSGLAGKAIVADAKEESYFFRRHLAPWAPRFFEDLENAPAARFYKAVGMLGRLYMDIEAEAFAMSS